MMLNLNRLALLVEFQRRGTLLEVSRALSFSPSTVSQQVKVLEREVGAVLLERSGRRLHLTREGRILADHATTIFGQMELAVAEVAGARTAARGTLRMAAFQTIALALLPRILDLLSAAEPELRTAVSHIEPARALDALVAREFDIVLGEEYPGRPLPRQKGVVMRTLLDDPLVLAVPNHVDATVGVAQLAAARPWAMAPMPYNARQWTTATFREMDVEPTVQYESSDWLVQMRLVETGHAIAILSQLLLDSERPDVQTLPLPGEPTRRIFVAFRAGAEASPAIAAAIAALSTAVDSAS